MSNKLINIILSSWWKRIFIFSLLVIIQIVIFQFLYFHFWVDSLNDVNALYNFNYLIVWTVLITSILSSSIIISAFRIDSSWFSFGIKPDIGAYRDSLLAVVLVTSSFIIILIICILLIGIPEIAEFVFDDIFILIIISSFFSAAFEELIFRGVIFQAIYERFGAIISVAGMSIFFGVGHALNPEVSILAVLNTIIVGVLLSMMYIHTRSLWLPVFYHFLWNIEQAMLINSNVSGFDLDISLVNLDISESSLWLFGGSYGIEGGLITTIILLLSFPVVFKFSSVSPYMAAILFRCGYQESKLLGLKKK